MVATLAQIPARPSWRISGSFIRHVWVRISSTPVVSGRHPKKGSGSVSGKLPERDAHPWVGHGS